MRADLNNISYTFLLETSFSVFFKNKNLNIAHNIPLFFPPETSVNSS